MNTIIPRLIKYADNNLNLHELDFDIVAKRLTFLFKCEGENLEEVYFIDRDVRAIFDDINKEYSKTLNLKGNKFYEFCDQIMDLLTPTNRNINNHFKDSALFNNIEALNYFYNININNKYIYSTASFQDEWIDLKDQYNYRYVLEDNSNLKVDSYNKRSVYLQDLIFTFNRMENIPFEFNLKVNGESQEKLAKEFSFLHDNPNLFIGTCGDHIVGGSKDIHFFNQKSSNTFEHPFFKGTLISEYRNKFKTLKVESNNAEDVIESIFYIENTWKAYGNDNSVYYYVSYDNHKYEAYIVLLDKKLSTIKDKPFINKIINDDFLYIGQVILHSDVKRDISKLANLLSDESFDKEWYLNANPELKSYENFITTLIDRKTQKVDKNEAIAMIQTELSNQINDALNEITSYNKDKELSKFMDMLK